jgi:hypothetical protein
MFYNDNLFIYHRRFVIVPFGSVVQWKSKEVQLKHCRQKNLLFNEVMPYSLNNAFDFMSLYRARSPSISLSMQVKETVRY